MIDYEKIKSVNYRQIKIMKHTIGFKGDKVKGRIYRQFEPVRNYYNAGKSDITYINSLVKMGLMKEYRPDYFELTEDGRKFLSMVLDVKILPETD
ncbi:MAG: hypothetical protein ACI4JM_05280 [Oscillospiraceae bacterium]